MIKYLLSFICFISLVSPVSGQQGFRESQQEFPRVRDAYGEKWEQVRQMLTAADIAPENLELYLVAFKQEKQLDVWAKQKDEKKFSLLTSYRICRTSGKSGPKRKQGDLQIPEGFYHINAWNPWSNFHLSMCINYPNRSDRVLGVQGNLGGNICIHGSCVTIGCIPLTDEVIKKLYILFVEAKTNGQTRIPVTIFPARLNQENYTRLVQEHPGDEDRLNLWKELKTAYELFIENRSLPEITFLSDGRHRIK